MIMAEPGTVHIDLTKERKSERDKVVIRPGIPGEELPPSPSKKKAKSKGKPGRPKKYDLDLADLKVPLGLLVIQLTSSLAERKKDERWVTTAIEAQKIEDAFNTWIEIRLEFLKVIYPELLVLCAVSSYFLRVSTMPKLPKSK